MRYPTALTIAQEFRTALALGASGGS